MVALPVRSSDSRICSGCKMLCEGEVEVKVEVMKKAAGTQ